MGTAAATGLVGWAWATMGVCGFALLLGSGAVYANVSICQVAGDCSVNVVGDNNHVINSCPLPTARFFPQSLRSLKRTVGSLQAEYADLKRRTSDLEDAVQTGDAKVAELQAELSAKNQELLADEELRNTVAKKLETAASSKRRKSTKRAGIRTSTSRATATSSQHRLQRRLGKRVSHPFGLADCPRAGSYAGRFHWQ